MGNCSSILLTGIQLLCFDASDKCHAHIHVAAGGLGESEGRGAFDGHTISDFYFPASAKPNTCPQITSFSPFND